MILKHLQCQYFTYHSRNLFNFSKNLTVLTLGDIDNPKIKYSTLFINVTAVISNFIRPQN